MQYKPTKFTFSQLIIFNFYVFYMFRNRGFIFRKTVVYTGVVHYEYTIVYIYIYIHTHTHTYYSVYICYVYIYSMYGGFILRKRIMYIEVGYIMYIL